MGGGNRRDRTAKGTRTVEPKMTPSVLGPLDAGEEWLYLVLAGLRDPVLHALIGGRVQAELFPPEMRLIKEAIDHLQEGRKNGKVLPLEALRLHLSRNRPNPALREVLQRLAQTRVPEEPVVLRGLKGVIQREGSRVLAEEILSQVELGQEEVNPETYRERLDQLCFDFEHDRGSYLALSKAPTSYHSVIEAGRISTGLPTVDGSLGGGLGMGEVGIIVSPPGGGKTAWLAHQGIQALLLGKHVVHISLEIHRLMVLERYDQALAGCHWNALRKHPGRVRQARKRVFDAGGSLDIYDLTDEAVGTGYLRSMLKKLDRRSSIDMVILDYVGLMARDRHPDQRFGELGNLVRKLRMIASKIGVPLWTAAQANREAILREQWGREMIAEDITLLHASDAVLCFNQTLVEKEARRGRILLEKTRRSSSNPLVNVAVDFDCMKFWEE